MDALDLLDKLPVSDQSDFDVEKWKQSCYDAMNDNFNTPILIAQLFEAVKHIHLIKEGKEKISSKDHELLVDTLNSFVYDVLGLEGKKEGDGNTDTLSGVVELLIELRNEARLNKDFSTSDRIRDQLLELGIQLKDGKEGTSFSIS